LDAEGDARHADRQRQGYERRVEHDAGVTGGSRSLSASRLRQKDHEGCERHSHRNRGATLMCDATTSGAELEDRTQADCSDTRNDHHVERRPERDVDAV
jgi:hypothetical protein